jgi:hypothetical protein
MWALLSLYLLAYLLAGLIAAGIYKRQARRTSAPVGSSSIVADKKELS